MRAIRFFMLQLPSVTFSRFPFLGVTSTLVLFCREQSHADDLAAWSFPFWDTFSHLEVLGGSVDECQLFGSEERHFFSSVDWDALNMGPGINASVLTPCELLGDVCMAVIHQHSGVSLSSLVPKDHRKLFLARARLYPMEKTN